MDPETQEAAEWMRRCARGDEQALAALYDRFTGPLLRFLERMCRDRATSEDLVQVVWMKVWDAAPRYEPTAKFTTWLFQIARNACLNELEKQGRRPTPVAIDGPDEEPGGASAPPDPGRSPERSALDRELGERIDAAVRRLPPKFREVWLLAALQEVPYPEVAQILDIPVGTVKSRMFQASRLLRSELEPYVS